MKKEKISENKIKKKLIILFFILILLFLFSTIFAILNSANNKIIYGVKINNINFSNKTENEAKNELNNIEENINNKIIKLKLGEYETEINLNIFEAVYNNDEAANEAYKIGRNNNIFLNNFTILKTLIFKENVNINKSYNKEILKEKINTINGELPNALEESKYYIEDDKLIITKGKSGNIVNENEFTNIIEHELFNFNSNQEGNIIQIPVIEKNPEEINLQKIRDEIYREPQDAYITTNPTTVHPNVNGVDFAISMEEARQIISEEKEEYEIPLKITVAEKTLNDLGEDAFPDNLGDYTTRYDASNKNRSNNIALASNKIDGTVIMPGETFSYNQIVGKRTIEAGYKEAGAYAGGKVVQEVGGGICQVSSTLYNAVLYANLEIVERSNHYFETSYVDPGRDATVSWGTVDLKFKNNRTYPIKVEAISKNGVCKIAIKGIKEKDDCEIVIQSKITSIIKKETKYEIDNSVEEGKELVKQEGHDGCTSETTKIVRQNGAIISSDIISKDLYHALDKIILKKQ